MALPDSLREQITTLVQQHHVVLFMKGERHAPACGFSSRVVGVLDGMLPDYATVNVLASPEIRDGIKEYSSWPTIPQLYVGGQFVGGADIVNDLAASGELYTVLGVTPPKAPTVTVSDTAAKAFRDAAGEAGDDVLHLEVGARGEFDLYFGPPGQGDVAVTANGVVMHLDTASARRAEGLSVDFVQGAGGREGGFKITLPSSANEASVKALSPAELKAMIDRGEQFALYDVRTEGERRIATLPNARHLDTSAEAQILALDRATPLVFHCHHGIRSLAAAEHFVREGFRTVYNLQGGIDAWSLLVDPTVARY